MKTLWQAPAGGRPSNKYVTREEIPGLVRRAIADMILGTGNVTVETAAAIDPKLDMVMKTKRPRAAGHTHRGRCGKKCFGRGA